MNLDFSQYTPDSTCNWMWVLSDAPHAELPLGASFSALYAPTLNLKQWTVVEYVIKTMLDFKRRPYRAYVVMERLELDYAPFDWQELVIPYELPKAESENKANVLEVEFLDYVLGAEPSEGVKAVLPTLGSYEVQEMEESHAA